MAGQKFKSVIVVVVVVIMIIIIIIIIVSCCCCYIMIGACYKMYTTKLRYHYILRLLIYYLVNRPTYFLTSPKIIKWQNVNFRQK